MQSEKFPTKCHKENYQQNKKADNVNKSERANTT